MVVAARPTRLRLAAPATAVEHSRSSAAWILAGLVALSFVVRTAIGWLRDTPVYLGDEYLYSALGRSLAESGRPLVRGDAADFPALLQPLLTAPAWLITDVGIAFQVVQGIGALVMSLAAVPAYWLARRLGLRAGLALGTAALTLVLPSLIYSSWIVAEPFAYPLVLAALAAGVTALERPSRRVQLAFVVFSALAAFARIQFVVLPVCFLGAVVVTGLRERRLRAALREQTLALALLAIAAAVAIALGPSRVLAFYGGVFHVDFEPLALLGRSGMNLLILFYASGAVLLPGAILGFALAFARPRSRAELAFAALTVLLAGSLLLEAGLFGAFDQAQERYLFYLLPPFAIGFGLYGSRGWPLRLLHTLFAAVLVAVAATIPLSGYAAADEKAHSPLLYGVYRMEQWLGSPGNGSLVVALGATIGLTLVAACSLRPRVATVAGLATAIAFCGGLGSAAVVFDQENSRNVRHAFLPADRSWVDHARVGDVALLRNIGGVRGAAFQQLFWNRSVKELLLMPGAPEIDSFRADRVRVADDGALFVGGASLKRALLVDEHAVTTQFTGVEKVGSGPGFSLYRPAGTPRLALFFLGRYEDGWLADRGTINLWPRRDEQGLRGTLVLELESPRDLGPTTVAFTLPDGRTVTLRLPAGRSVTARLPVCSGGPWALGFHSKLRAFVADRAVSAKAGIPRFVPGVGCRAPLPRAAAKTA